MKPKDSDTFIDIGVSITRLLLIASGQGTAASLIGEGAGLIKNLGSGGQRAVSAEKIAADVAARLPRESWDISEADWHAAATHVAPLIDRLSEKDRLAAGYDWTALRPVLLDLGGEERRRKLADESARRAFDWVLDVACQRIADLFTEKEALASLLEKVDGVQSGVQQLLNRPAEASKTRDVINDHIEVLRELAPDRLEDRESEMTDLEAFVRSSDDVWYAMEADMVSGKTAVMASFALNPPDDVHMASFFIRRIGGDGSDRGSFAFVMSAQLAKILGHEYTEPGILGHVVAFVVHQPQIVVYQPQSVLGLGMPLIRSPAEPGRRKGRNCEDQQHGHHGKAQPRPQPHVILLCAKNMGHGPRARRGPVCWWQMPAICRRALSG